MWPEINETELRAYFKAELGRPVFLAVQTPEEVLPELVPAEREQLAILSAESRIRDYQLGRGALKRVLAEQGRNVDTTLVHWPDARCSLSHSSGFAIAVGLCGSDEGIGVDLQLIKRPHMAVAERILSNETLTYWLQLPENEQADALLRYWTANEAIYKACPSPQPAYFRHYRLMQPEHATSIAVIDGAPFQFRVASMKLPEGYLSIAVRLPVALAA